MLGCRLEDGDQGQHCNNCFGSTAVQKSWTWMCNGVSESSMNEAKVTFGFLQTLVVNVVGPEEIG